MPTEKPTRPDVERLERLADECDELVTINRGRASELDLRDEVLALCAYIRELEAEVERLRGVYRNSPSVGVTSHD